MHDDYLAHKGHKYIKREWKDGKWKYYYETKSTIRTNGTITMPNGKGGTSSTQFNKTYQTVDKHELKTLSKLADWAGADEKTNLVAAKNKLTSDTTKYNKAVKSKELVAKVFSKENAAVNKSRIEEAKARDAYNKTLMGISENTINKGKTILQNILKKK